jgi:GNAT superfamily N-acetyltransferase
MCAACATLNKDVSKQDVPTTGRAPLGSESLAVTVKPQVEVATRRDLEVLAALRLAQGWHAQRRLLASMLDWERGRIFVVRDAETARAEVVASSAATACDAVGVIGNVMVRADRQRRGLGRLVVEAALTWLRGRSVQSVLLDATIEGRPLYFKLGFVPYEQSWFAHGSPVQVTQALLHERAGALRAWRRPATELERVAALDMAAFGGNRLGLLARLLAYPRTALFVVDGRDGEPAGYALARPLEAPSLGVRIGPWVAMSEQAAAAALAAALAVDAPWRAAVGGAAEGDIALDVSIPGTSKGALALAQGIGLHVFEDDVLMQLDLNVAGTKPTRPEELRQTALHPEWVYAWIASLVF